MIKPDNVVQLTSEDNTLTKIINSFTHTLSRMGSAVGFGVSPDGKRNYNAIFGYGENLTYSDFFGMYERSAIGNAVVGKVSRACWNEQPVIKINEDDEILEDEINQLDKLGFFRAMERADTLNRIGDYSVLFIGIPDGLEPDQPLGTATDLQGVYFNPYNEDGITILKWDIDPTSKRWGLPELYQLQTTSHGEKNTDIHKKAVVVHWSRIIHLAEGALDSTVEGSSSLKPVWNKLTDLVKLGGASEAYFRNSRQQRVLEADKEAQLQPGSAELAALKSNIDAFDNNWDSTLRLQNMKATLLQIQMISPRDTFDTVVEEISGQTGIPIRILTGKGGGQLAGSEDRASWNGIIADRRATECNNYLMQGLDIFNNAGLFDVPDDAVISWPPQVSLNEKEAADVNKVRADTLNVLTDVLGKPVGDEIDSKSALEVVGLEDVEINDDLIIDEPIEPDEQLNLPTPEDDDDVN